MSNLNYNFRCDINSIKAFTEEQSKNKSFYALDKWFESWYSFNEKIPICFLSYESLSDLDVLKKLAEFLGVDQKITSPIKEKYRTRKSNFNNTEADPKKITLMFEDLISKLKRIGPFYVKY